MDFVFIFIYDHDVIALYRTKCLLSCTEVIEFLAL